MSHAILLNDSLNTVKRLCLNVDGSATLQYFTKAGRVEIHLTAEELELVRTSCRIPDCDCQARERWELTPFPYTVASNGFMGEEPPHEQP